MKRDTEPCPHCKAEIDVSQHGRHLATCIDNPVVMAATRELLRVTPDSETMIGMKQFERRRKAAKNKSIPNCTSLAKQCGGSWQQVAAKVGLWRPLSSENKGAMNAPLSFEERHACVLRVGRADTIQEGKL